MNARFKLSLIILLLCAKMSSIAQIQTYYLDSIPISKPKRNKSLYQFNHSILKEVKIKSRGLSRTPYKPDEAMFNFAGDVITLFLGEIFSTASSSVDINWALGASLNCESDYLNWNLNLFAIGTLNKEKEYVVNSDGSKSLVKTKWAILNWDEGATGMIIERGDTISKFRIIMYPVEDSLIFNTYGTVFDEPRTQHIRTGSSSLFYNDRINSSLIEYGIIGIFRGDNIVLVANGYSRNMWFFVNGKLICVFQPDLDDLEVKKKDRMMPYLLIDDKVSDSQIPDWYRWAVVSRYMSTVLAKERFTW